MGKINQNQNVYSQIGSNNYSWDVPSSTTDVPVGAYRIQVEASGAQVSLSSKFEISNLEQVAMPVISPESGNYNSTQVVSITCSTTGSEIVYTTNGTNPNDFGILYQGTFSVIPPKTIKAVARKSGLPNSSVNTAVYETDPDMVTITQLDKNSVSFGGLSMWTIYDFWTGFSSGEITIRDPDMILKAEQDFKEGTSEKFNKWSDSRNSSFYQNWKSIRTYSNTTWINANFSEAHNATIQNTLEGYTSITDGTISFKDPWKLDDNTDLSKGIRNKGNNASILSYNSPHSINTSSEFMGVLLNQEFDEDTYYSGEASSTQQIGDDDVTFVNWSAIEADVISPNATNTPIVFRSQNAIVKANYKGTHISNNSNAYSNNSQRKFVRTDNGYLHIVYESMGKAWYEISTNNGLTWALANNGNPLMW